MLSETLKSQIKEYSLSKYPEESCGILVKDKDNELVFCPCKNISCNDKEKSFEIDSIDYIKALRFGRFYSVVHSQPNSGASPLDEINASGHNIKSLIYCVKDDIFIEVGESNLKQYIGIPFKIGVNDCLSLVRSYFYNELNIVINDYEREEGWFEKNPNIILENFEKEGFIKVEDLKKDDVILFSFGGNLPHHIAIYVGNNNILDNTRNSISKIEFLSEPLKRRISFILRHKSLL